jgi:hypothetical protein
MYKEAFRMPTTITIAQRTSSVTNAFVSGIIPVIEPTEEEIKAVLDILNIDVNNVVCAYCGDKCTEWDHFRPLVVNKRPTGYISEINNLVPACGKCNQSKGNKNWKDWMLSDAKQSPKSRNISDIADRIKRLEEYERKFTPTILDFEELVGENMWKQYWNKCEQLHKMMIESQTSSDKIKHLVSEAINK